MRKSTILLLSIAVLALAGCSKTGAPKEPMKITINVWPGYAHAFIAREKGYFKKNGVNVELILKNEQTESLELYKNGGCDGVFTVIPDILAVNFEGIPSKIVCIVDYSTTGDVIIAKPEIKSAAGLKGKTVSFEGVSSFSNIFVLKALENAGLNETDVNFKNTPAHQVLDELEKGEIDAGHTWNPTKTEALKKGYKIIVSAADCPGIIVDVLVFNADIIAKRGDEIKAVVKSLFEARDFINTNGHEAAEIMSKAEGMSKEAIEDGLNGIIQPDIKDNLEVFHGRGEKSTMSATVNYISDFYIKRGQTYRVFKFEDIIEPKFVEELSSEQ